MKKAKKILLTVGAYILTAALAIGGTVAYLQDEKSDVNVMTLGNVKIEQIEQEYDENGNLVDFTQDKPLYPYVGELGWKNLGDNGAYRQFTMNNVIDKYVSVKNTGKSDAYVRTLIALEMGSLSIEELASVIGLSTNNENGSEFKFPGAWNVVKDYVDVIDGKNYNVMEFVHSAPLKPGETTVPSLLQVYLSKNATNEHVEKLDGNGNGKYDILVLSQAVQAAGFENANDALQGRTTTFAAAKAALDTAFGVPEQKKANAEITNCAEWFTGAIADYEAEVEAAKKDTWDGTADTSWYNDTDKEFALTTSEQLAGLGELVDGGNTFEGKTITLSKNLDLAGVVFEPIGSYRKDTSFKGTFDGQNHTISGMSQNTWALDNGYYYSDCGLGFFGAVEDATIKNLIIDRADISGESALCGTVAAVSGGKTTFENITVTNTNVADYQYYAGGIVGWASGEQTFKNINVDASTTIAAQWGDFDNSTGGVVGGASGNATIVMKDCNVACRIDAYNDVTSSYQWYAYRRCGMLIGNPGKTQDIDGRTCAAAPQLTCENVTVTYNDWANYTYCEFAGTSWPYVRVQAGVSNSAYSNPRYGHPTDANGNQVVDDNHVHNAGEDHFINCTFDQLYGGGQGVYGCPTHDGVNVVYNNK